MSERPYGKTAYVGANNTAYGITDVYVGVNDIARRIVKGYVGVNNVARVCYLQAYTFTVNQSANETITVKTNRGTYTSTFTAYYGDTWTATVSPASGYNAGLLSATNGTVTDNVTVSVGAATKAYTYITKTYSNKTKTTSDDFYDSQTFSFVVPNISGLTARFYGRINGWTTSLLEIYQDNTRIFEAPSNGNFDQTITLAPNATYRLHAEVATYLEDSTFHWDISELTYNVYYPQ